MVVLMLLLFFGTNWFNLPYPKGTPLVFSDEYCNDISTSNMNYPCVANTMSNKAHLYTIVF